MQEHKEDHLPSIFASFHSLSLFLSSIRCLFFIARERKRFSILIIDEKFRHLFHPADELKFFIFFFFHFLNFEFLWKIKMTLMNLLIHINIYDHNWNSVSRNDSKRDIYLEIFLTISHLVKMIRYSKIRLADQLKRYNDRALRNSLM